MGLTLTKISETSTKITLGWTPVPGAVGYRFQSATQAPKWSHSWNATLAQTTFSKADWYKVEALGVESAGQYPSLAPTALPASRVILDPGEIAAWMVCDSPATQIAPVGSDSNWDKHNIVAWAPSQYLQPATPLYAPPQKMYALHGFRVLQGIPGRMVDYHTAPSDQPHGWTPKMYPGGPGTGVAPLAIDYWNDANGLQVITQPEDYSPYDPGSGKYHYSLLSHSEMQARLGQWIWVWLEVVWGASWLSQQGSLRACLAGDTTWRVNAPNINTHWFEQHFTTLWEGAYVSYGAASRVEVEVAGRRIGKTPQAALADTPQVFTRFQAGNPAGSISAIPDVPGSVQAPPA
jgi:hypothetical protein